MKAGSTRYNLLSASSNFWFLAIYLSLVFLMGGSGRLDIQSLAILRPISILFCGIAVFNLKLAHIQSNKFLFAFMLSLILIVIFHIIPLPPSWINSLPDRELVSIVTQLNEFAPIWLPLSVFPTASLDSLYSLSVPAVVLLFGIQLEKQELMRLLPLIIIFGLISTFLAFLQIIGDPQSSLYLYRITNNGSAVGLFANRNHHALFLAMLLPIVGVFAGNSRYLSQTSQLKIGLLVAVTIILIPLLLVTGSRAGLLAGILGLIFMILFYRSSESQKARDASNKNRRLRNLSGGFAIASLVALTLLMSRAESVYRLIGSESSESLRFKMWGPIFNAAGKLFPFGSGIGTFSAHYQMNEPTELLIPFYPNQAHNDLLDIYLTTGAIGIALILIAGLGWVAAAVYIFRHRRRQNREIAFGKLGLICSGLIFGCSLVDYPLRTPIIGGLLVVFSLWIQMGVLNVERRHRASFD